MLKYTLVVVLCFAFFYEAQGAEELKSTKDDAKKTFYLLMAMIDKAMSQAQNDLNMALEQVKDKGAELEEKTKDQLDKTLVPLRKKLDDLIANAKGTGSDVTECLNYVDHFSNTPNDLVEDLSNCVDQQTTKAQSYANVALLGGREIELDLKTTIGQKIDQCEGSKLTRFICYSKIITIIAQDVRAALHDITKDVSKAKGSVLGVVPNLQQCVNNQLKTATEDAAHKVKDFENCVSIPF